MKARKALVIATLASVWFAGGCNSGGTSFPGIGNVTSLENVRDAQGNVTEQFATNDKGQKFHAKPEDVSFTQLVFLVDMPDGRQVALTADGIDCHGRVWYVRDVTNPANPRFVNAGFEKGGFPVLKVNDKEVSVFLDASIAGNNMPQFFCIGIDKEDVDETFTLTGPIAAPSIVEGLGTPPAGYKYRAKVTARGETYSVDLGKTDFLVLGTRLVAFADLVSDDE